MGTRADFYIGRGEAAEWLGSIAWDGFPSERTEGLKRALTAGDFRVEVGLLSSRADFTDPASDGWPWPWPTSHTTDYSYAFDEGTVWATCFGSAWWLATDDEPDTPTDSKGSPDGHGKYIVHPVMDTSRWTLGSRSGVIVVGR